MMKNIIQKLKANKIEITVSIILISNIIIIIVFFDPSCVYYSYGPTKPNSRFDLAGPKTVDYKLLNNLRYQLIDELTTDSEYNKKDAIFILTKMPKFNYKIKKFDLDYLNSKIQEEKDKLKEMENQYKINKSKKHYNEIVLQKEIIKKKYEEINAFQINEKNAKNERNEYYQVLEDLKNHKYVDSKKILKFLE